MGTDKTDQDHYGKIKLELNLLKDDYLRSYNKNYEQVENTTRIFGNQIENITANEIKPENLGNHLLNLSHIG
ncbi:hypothetical protein Godav_004431 [Gossypium davidsonii]|uniref:Uncharacterized protein n=1 Tax=Gossypium davidsonii TaxID=34287 RepID=A0A7J8SL49_GOSDV|nr:hypothetical protein [Gossypium davidsonii]